MHRFSLPSLIVTSVLVLSAQGSAWGQAWQPASPQPPPPQPYAPQLAPTPQPDAPQPPPPPAAESPPSQPLRVGIRAGFNFATWAGDNVNESAAESRVGVAIGGYATFALSSSLSLQPELYYSMEGTKTKESFGSATFSMDYIRVPLLVRVNLPVNSQIGVHVVGGPNIGVLLNAEVEEGGQQLDFKDNASAIDFGLSVGAGVDIPLQAGGLNFEARYMLGLTSVDDTSDDADISNRVFSLLAGYYF